VSLPDDVPGKVIASFRAGSTLQQIRSLTVAEYTRMLWSDLTGIPVVLGTRGTTQDLFALLDDEDAENLVFIYLQTKGWVVVPRSRSKDTMGYEYVLIRPRDGRRAVVQVKTGNTALQISDLGQPDCTAFFFQTSGIYLGDDLPETVRLSPTDIESFARANPLLMPGCIGRRIRHLQRLSLTARDETKVRT
jgi:hypothetical protein